MAATTYTGTGSSVSIANTVNGVNFQPDFVWIKSRSGAGYNHILFDTIRGATKYLSSNATTAETTNTGTLTAFNSNGFTVSFDAEANGSGQTFVGWQWKAGGTAVTNTAGSITSSVSANTTAGFSVVTYTGNGTSGATIGHGLGIAPSMVIAKKRNDVDNWMVYHSGLTSASYFVKLNATSSQVSDTSIWNGTAPSSSVFTVGSGAGTNQSSSYTYVAYCFAAIAGYSAFGSYTGNGSSDGPFVYLGFRPRFIMMKVSSASGYNWEMVDTARNVYNPQDLSLYANLSAAEDDYTATYPFDFLSNGFKPRGTSVHNASGQTYIYACFAENPFQNALAR
jgi:hypothetical protein